MSGYVAYSLNVDRPSATYELNVEYHVDGYSDPETGEYFGDTSWSLSVYRVPGGYQGGTGGYASEGDSLTFGLGADPEPVLHRYLLEFSAFNTFSAASVAQSWNVFSIASAVADQVVLGTEGVDVVIGGAGADILHGLAANDVMDGGEGNDLLDGGAGADTLDGGLGADIMIGGTDNDAYVVDSEADLVVERNAEGHDTIRSLASYTLPANVERLDLLGGAPISGTGGLGGDRIDGNVAANSLYGLDGDDSLYGNGGNDRLYGGDGSDTLDGGLGRDRMEGGSGDDLYFVDSAGEGVVELAGGGIDTVRVAGLATYLLGAQLENLATSAFTSFRGFGNDLNNGLTGGAGNDVLDGGPGNDGLFGLDGNDLLMGGPGSDALYGGGGVDRASYASSPAGVKVNLGTKSGQGGDAQGDGLIGIEIVIGSDANDVLTGNAVANTLSGGLGADTLNGGGGHDVILGGAGADSLDGGTGVDTVSYAGSTAGGVAVDLALQLGTAHGGDAEGDTLANFENVTGGDGDDTLEGDGHANRLSGAAGDDTLYGAAGNDVIDGGAGADWLDGAEGIDTVAFGHSTVGVNLDLALQTAQGGEAQGDLLAGFENARGGDGDDTIVGSADRNVIWGGPGADTIDGGDGNDLVIGGAGADTLDGGPGIDTLGYGGSADGVTVDLGAHTTWGGDAAGDAFSGFENLTGSDGGDYLVGDAGGNFLSSSSGFDLLDGRGGNDTLSGGAHDDQFIFGAGYGHDRITDFLAGLEHGDTIVLSLGAAFDSFAEVMTIAHSVGAASQHTVLQFDADTSLTLLNVARASLVDGDFVF